jgi:hypothetical protein
MKTVAFKRRYPVRSKMVIYNNIIGEMNTKALLVFYFALFDSGMKYYS